jgi:HPt (histidine-containing phosphotransfer) domain-containing protein
MDDYLSKPFTKKDLSDVLEKHFQVQSLPLNLDLEENMIQHSLSNIIEPKMLAGLLEIESNDQRGFVFEILDVFIEHAEEKIAETDEAIVAKDIAVVKNNAHNLKGSGGNVGLTNISKLFEDLENKSKEGDWNEIASVFEKTKRVFEETKQKILERKP